jgi:hypothetical protein
LTTLMTQAQTAGVLRAGANPRRLASLTMQTEMFVAQTGGAADAATAHPVTADEIWNFCAGGFVHKGR